MVVQARRRALLGLGLWAAAAAAAAAPPRIVSLLPSLTETVCALQACALLVGTDRYSNWPASVRALPKLGGIDDAQVERIVALRPDLVLAAPSSRVGARLSALGVEVLALASDSHQDVRHSIEQIAARLGEPARGAALWAGIEAALAAAAARVPPALRGQRVYFEVDEGAYAAGSSSFIGQTLQRLGLGNIVPASMGPFPKLNPEFIVREDPDLILAPARELAAMPRRPGWRGLSALRGPGVRGCGFDAADYELLIRPGPRLGEAAARVADCLAALPERRP